MPSDGKVLIYGEADKGVIEQVKGVNYSLKQFLGPNSREVYQSAYNSPMSELEVDEKLKKADRTHANTSDSGYYRSGLPSHYLSWRICVVSSFKEQTTLFKCRFYRIRQL